MTEGGKISFTGAVQLAGRTAQSLQHSAEIDSPGMVSVNRINAINYPRLTGAQLFGVDTITVVNGKAYIGYPSTSGALNDLRVVDLATYSVKRLDLASIPIAVAVIPLQQGYLPLISK